MLRDGEDQFTEKERDKIMEYIQSGEIDLSNSTI